MRPEDRRRILHMIEAAETLGEFVRHTIAGSENLACVERRSLALASGY
jgi:hypothetical protein